MPGRTARPELQLPDGQLVGGPVHRHTDLVAQALALHEVGRQRPAVLFLQHEAAFTDRPHRNRGDLPGNRLIDLLRVVASREHFVDRDSFAPGHQDMPCLVRSGWQVALGTGLVLLGVLLGDEGQDVPAGLFTVGVVVAIDLATIVPNGQEGALAIGSALRKSLHVRASMDFGEERVRRAGHACVPVAGHGRIQNQSSTLAAAENIKETTKNTPLVIMSFSASHTRHYTYCEISNQHGFLVIAAWT